MSVDKTKGSLNRSEQVDHVVRNEPRDILSRAVSVNIKGSILRHKKQPYACSDFKEIAVKPRSNGEK